METPVVLGLAGSPRRGGNTETLLDWALAAAEETGARIVKYRLCDLALSGCRACDACFEEGTCILDDGMSELYPLLRSADAIVLAAPIYSMGLNAQTKAFVDRCQPFWVLKYVRGETLLEPNRPKRRGVFLSCAGTTFQNVFAGANQVVGYLWHVLEVASVGELLLPGVDKRGEVALHAQAEMRARVAGVRLVQAGSASDPSG